MKNSGEKILYFDCFSGISGDMTLGALIDLGAPAHRLEDDLKGLFGDDGFGIEAVDVLVSGIHAKDVVIRCDDDCGARNHAAVKSMIRNSELSDGVKTRSLAVFERLAAAEAGIHNKPVESVHFHELGGVDSIADIVGTALCLEYLKVDRIYASKIPLGKGRVTCRHGVLPIPAPATLELLKGVPVYDGDAESEMATPTGAAVISELARGFGRMPEMRITGTGYGSGKKRFQGMPNLLRVIMGEGGMDIADARADSICIVKTSIDDMIPELYEPLMERLFAAGCLDVCLLPAVMKKNRPAVVVEVLCHEDKRDAVIRVILSETTSTGVRFYNARRRMLKREETLLNTKFGRIKAKKITEPDGTQTVAPEYEECKSAARRLNIPVKRVYDEVIAAGCATTDTKT